MGEESAVLAMWVLTVALVVVGSLHRTIVTFPAPLRRTARTIAPTASLLALVMAVALRFGL